AAALVYSTPILGRQDYHISILTGEGWVQELIHGHPDWIKIELGMQLHVFQQLITVLQECGLRASKHVSLGEQLVIFLY
ncbi:hypothetical protein JAAARDRAFT_90291, partial [Jaapia argillacea MUCL 33604]